jgi:hypothetical protein
MKDLNRRAPRIAGLLALALGAVALLAVSGVAAAKDHGHDNGGHHGRHHHHVIDMREAGTISSFDASTGKLTIALLDSGTVTGLVTEDTEIKCEGVDNRLDHRDHGGGDNSGSGSGDDNGGQSEPGDDNGGRGEPEPGDDNGGEVAGEGAPGESSCTTASLVPGAVVGDAELRLEGGSAVFKEIELGNHS